MFHYCLNRITTLIFISVWLTGCASQSSQPTIPAKTLSAEQQVSHSYCYKFLYGDYATQPDYSRAMHWCQQGALSGQAQTQTLLAEIYFLGLGVETNHHYAFKWYHSAAEQGHAHAQFMLYHFYDKGLSLSADHSKAMKWLNKAAKQGHAQANNVLTQEAESSTDT
jgi:TPR repeat protein